MIFIWSKNKLNDESGFVGAALIAGAAMAGAAAVAVGAGIFVTVGVAVIGAAAAYYAMEEMMPDMPDMASSPTYSSDKIGNTMSEGGFVARCYGKCKIGGNKIRFNTATDSDLRVIVGHCGGEVEGITRWEVNDIEWSELTGSHTKTEYTGTRTQTADSRFTSRESAYRGIAYTAFTFAKNDKQTGYNPNVTVVMEGLKCAPLAGGADIFTRNPAVILYDWYLNVEGYSAGDLDLNAFQSLEALCDEVPTGGTLPRYRFDFNFDTNMSINDAKKLIWSSFNGFSIMSQGKIKPIWDSGQMADGAGGLTTKTVSHAFTLDNIVKDSFSWNQPERSNITRIKYKDSTRQYKTSSVEIKDESNINQNGEILFEENAFFITDTEIARRRAKYKYNRKRYLDYSATFTALSGASDLEVLDLVTITHLLPGWTAKQFIITNRKENDLGQMEFTAEAYYSGAYDDGEVGEQDSYESTLPNPYQVPGASTSISAAMTAVGTAYDFDAVRVTFTPPTADPFYAYSEIYASNDDSTYYYIGRDGTGEFTFSALGVIYEPGDTCYIKIRSVSEVGVPQDLPGVYDTSVLISSTMRIGGFYAGLTFISDNAVEANAKIYIDKTNTLMRLGPTTGDYLVNDGDLSGEPAVYSSNYVSGVHGSGFMLKSDLLEVGNIASRGIIRTAVFQKDVVSAVGGNLAVLPADVLSSDMTALDASNLTIEGNESFSVGDIVRIKDGIDDEWIEITGIGSAPTYSITRDRAGVYAANTNPTWKKGASVINYKQSGGGGVYMTSSESNAPYMSVFTHSGSPWSDIDTRLRVGNLNGFLGYASDLYGIAIGETDKYLKYDPTNGLQIRGEIIITGGSGYSNISDAPQTADIVNFPTVESGGVLRTGNTLEKTGATAWDGQSYSTVGYTGGVRLSFTPNQTDRHIMIGLDENPSLDADYVNIDYCFYCDTSGSLKYRESGSGATFGPYVAGDLLELVYTGAQIIYYQNGTALRSQTVAITNPLYMDSSFLESGATISNVRFGSYADITQTALDAGAAIDDAIANGVTLISGGYIRTSLLHTTVLVVGDNAGLLAVEDEVDESLINVTDLAGINSDMGAIVAGTITLNSSGFIRGGQTAYATGTGFFLGYSGAAYKLSIGDSTKYLRWDGSTLTVGGDIVATENIQDDAVTIPVSAFTSGTYSTDAGNCQTASITSTGSPILITFTVSANAFVDGGSGVAEQDCTITLLRGAATLMGVKVAGGNSDVQLYDTLAGAYIDTPGSGSVTYNLKFEKSGSTDNVTNRAITLLEVKK